MACTCLAVMCPNNGAMMSILQSKFMCKLEMGSAYPQPLNESSAFGGCEVFQRKITGTSISGNTVRVFIDIYYIHKGQAPRCPSGGSVFLKRCSNRFVCLQLSTISLVKPFGLQDSSSVLLRVIKAGMWRGLHGPASDGAHPARPGLGPGVPEAHGPLHRCVMLYMDDLLCYSPTLEQYLRNVWEVPCILRQEKHQRL